MSRWGPRVSRLTAVLSIVLMGAAAAGSGALAAGGARVFDAPAPARLGPSDDAWNNPVGAVAPAHNLELPPTSTPPAISLAVPLARLEEPTLAYTPPGTVIVDDAMGAGLSWTATPPSAVTFVGAGPWAPPALFAAPQPLLGDQLARQPSDDSGELLAQSPPSSAAAGAPSEAAKEADLAKQLANPVSSLISVPFQQNIQFGIGPANAGWQDLMNIQPVVPFGISADWNVIARMIMPVTYQDEIFPGTGSQFGIGDTTFQFFFSPKAPTKDGVIWGVGPLFFVPSGSYLLSTSTWGAGVAAVALKQIPKPYMGGGILTIGALVTQLWPVSGAAPINSLYLQPFVSYTLKSSVTYTFQTQATYNWAQSQWTVPLILSVSKVYRFGGQLTSLAFGLKYYPVRPVTAPQWGLQLVVTLLFPKK